MKGPQAHLDIHLAQMNRMGKTAIKGHRKHFRANVRKPKRPDGSEAYPWMSNCYLCFQKFWFSYDPFFYPLYSLLVQARPSLVPQHVFTLRVLGFMTGTPCMSSGFKDSKCLQVRGSFPTASGRRRPLWKPENWALAVFHKSADLHVW